MATAPAGDVGSRSRRCRGFGQLPSVPGGIADAESVGVSAIRHGPGTALACLAAAACGVDGGAGTGHDDRFDDRGDIALVVSARTPSIEAALGDYAIASTMARSEDTISIETDELIYPVKKATAVSLDAPVERVFQVDVRENAGAEWAPLRPEVAGETWTWTELIIHRGYDQFQFAGNGAPYGGLGDVIEDVQIARDLLELQVRILAMPAPAAPGDYETTVSLSRLSE